MKKIIIMNIICTTIILSTLVSVLTFGVYQRLSQDIPEFESNYQPVAVTDRINVDQDIIEGYEGEDYIPRCVACNDRGSK